MKIITYVLIFLLFGAFLIQVNYEYNLKEREDQRGFMYQFGSWVSNLFDNVRVLTGYAIRMEWLPDGTEVTDSIDYVMNQSDYEESYDINATNETIDNYSNDYNDSPEVIIID